MVRFVGTVLASMVTVAGVFTMLVPQASAGVMQASSAVVGNETSVPFGWVDFCGRYRGQCPDNTLAPQAIVLTADSFAEISRINHASTRQSSRPPMKIIGTRWTSGTCRWTDAVTARIMLCSSANC